MTSPMGAGSRANAPTGDTSTTSPIAIVGAWLFVGIPLAWGVSQVFIKSLALFR